MYVSVVIPCYNVEKYIKECLESVASQTYKHIELICVNDGSTDNTRSIIEEFIKTSSIDVKIIDRPNGGQCAARNTGIKSARGEYIHFLDSDDLMMPNKVENVVKLIMRDKERACFIVGDYIYRSINGKEVIKRVDQSDGWYGLISSQLGISSSITCRKECLKKVNYWDEKVKSSAEYEFLFRLLRYGHRHVRDPEPLIIVRERQNGSITQTNRKENLVRFIDLRIRILEHLRDNELLSEELEKHACQTIFTALRMLYIYDASKSRSLYNKLIPKTFKPEVSPALTRKYVLTYNLFGYSMAQKLWELWRHFSDSKRTRIEPQ